jgi:hypothetical protein
MVARNVTKNLAVAEDILHGVGEVAQLRNGEVLTVHRVDIPVGISTEAELFDLDPAMYPRARFGNTEFEYISGGWQARLIIAPYLLTAGIELDARYNQVLKDGVIARYIGTLPYVTTGIEDITTGSWEILGGVGGSSSGGGIEYVSAMPTTATEGTTLFQQNSYDLGFTINDGSSVQIIEFSLTNAAAYSSGGSAGGAITLANAGGLGNPLLNTIAPDSYSVKRVKAGANVTVTDDGNALTINASGVGAGTTTLSNAGVTGLPLVSSIVGADYPIKRIVAGTNVTIDDNGTYYTINASVAGGGISSLQNVNDTIGFAVYKETTAGVGYFRRLQSSDSSIIITTDVASVDFQLNSVPYTKIASVPTAKLLGRSTAGTGVAEVITLGTNLSFAGTTLNATGGVTDGDKGDIVVSGSGSSWSFDPAVVTAFAKTFLDDTTASGVRATIGAQTTSAVLDNLVSAAWAANKLVYSTGATSFATSDLTATARTVLAGSTITAMLNALGILTLSNANGVTLRFPTASATTGIQICFKTGLSTGSITNTHGTVFSGGGQQWDYPNIFSATPAVMGFVTDANAAWVGGGLSATTASAAFFRGFSGVSGTTAAICMIAIGTY